MTLFDDARDQDAFLREAIDGKPLDRAARAAGRERQACRGTGSNTVQLDHWRAGEVGRAGAIDDEGVNDVRQRRAQGDGVRSGTRDVEVDPVGAVSVGVGGIVGCEDRLPQRNPAVRAFVRQQFADRDGARREGRVVSVADRIDHQSGGVTLEEHATAVAGAVAGPSHHRLPDRVHSHSRIELIAAGRAVDPHLATVGGAIGVVLLPVDAPSGPVLALAGPHHHEVAVDIHRHGGVLLLAGGVAVDPELAALRNAGGVVALRVDAAAAAAS